MPAAAEPERDATVRQLVDGGNRLREHRGISVPGAVDEASALDLRGGESERGVRRERFETLVPRLHPAVLRDRRVGRVEVVPHGDPVEAVVLDTAPERLELRRGRVLKSCVDAKVHAEEPRAHAPRASNAPDRCGRGEPYSGRMLEVVTWPELRDPVLVLALSGWVDAGMAGAHASALLREHLGAARVFALLDLADLCDLHKTRPMV